VKNILLTGIYILLAITSSSFSQTGWYIIPGITAETLTTVHSTGNIYWVVGTNGTILTTTDAGINWTEIQSGATVNLSGIHKPTSSQIWVAGDSGTVLVTTNAGATWGQRNPGSTANFRSIFSRGSGVAYVIGDSGSCYYTANIGVNWGYRGVPTNEDLNAGIGPTSGTSLIALVGGNNGAIFKTTNAGLNWDIIPSGTLNHIYGFGFGPAGYVFAVGANGTMLRSTNAGDSWTIVSVPTSEDLHSFSSSGQNANWLVACGSNGAILKSTDAGNNWFLQSTPTTETLLSIVAPSNSVHFAVGKNGIILKTTDGGGDPVSVNDEINAPEEFELFQNYPNPFNPVTTIQYSVPQRTRVILKIYDILGNEVATLVNDELSAGEYEVEFNASSGSSFQLVRNLSSGIYYYTLITGNYSQTKKMILLK
jgi:photosystem II stability/assembly factor-like uncharacterized protein